MSLEDLVQLSPWQRYSKKMAAKIEAPRNFGWFTKEDAQERGMRYVEGKEGLIVDGNEVHFYWLVDEDDGMIVDARFQLFGQSALIAAAEAACDLVVGKNYDQAKRISAELIDKQLRDHPDRPAFPEETYAHLNLVVDAIEDGVEQCLDLPLPKSYASPVPEQMEGEAYPGWEELVQEQKLAVIEEVIAKEIRPYIELDAGGIEIIELKQMELTIGYQGACTSCFSAIGGTLATIQQILKAKIHPDLKVIPDMSGLKL